MIYALLSWEFTHFFRRFFLDWKAKSADIFIFWMYVGSSLWILGNQNILFVKVLNKVLMSILLWCSYFLPILPSPVLNERPKTWWTRRRRLSIWRRGWGRGWQRLISSCQMPALSQCKTTWNFGSKSGDKFRLVSLLQVFSHPGGRESWVFSSSSSLFL